MLLLGYCWDQAPTLSISNAIANAIFLESSFILPPILTGFRCDSEATRAPVFRHIAELLRHFANVRNPQGIQLSINVFFGISSYLIEACFASRTDRTTFHIRPP